MLAGTSIWDPVSGSFCSGPGFINYTEGLCETPSVYVTKKPRSPQTRRRRVLAQIIMKFCRFKTDGIPRVGCIVGKTDNKILDISDKVGGADVIATFEDVQRRRQLEQLVNENRSNHEELTDIKEVELLPPVERPGKIVCLAGNYASHIVESGYVEPETRSNFTQQLFLKPPSSLIGDGGVIELGKNNHRVGWETELALVIGAGGKNISPDDAFDHVFGYTILN